MFQLVCSAGHTVSSCECMSFIAATRLDSQAIVLSEATLRFATPVLRDGSKEKENEHKQAVRLVLVWNERILVSKDCNGAKNSAENVEIFEACDIVIMSCTFLSCFLVT
jgi:hypothetical protein